MGDLDTWIKLLLPLSGGLVAFVVVRERTRYLEERLAKLETKQESEYQEHRSRLHEYGNDLIALQNGILLARIEAGLGPIAEAPRRREDKEKGSR